jgi:penicillin amidase
MNDDIAQCPFPARSRNARRARPSMARRFWLLLLALSACSRGVEAPLVPQPAVEPRASLSLPSLGQEVYVRRDALGIPSIEAATREDALRGLGHAVAEDRLFQLDLLRRASAGRLAEVLGPELVAADTRQRIQGSSDAADAIVARLPDPQRRALEAYADGVNAYLAAADSLPFEFGVLGYRPEAWRPRDSVLVVLSMVDLLGESEELERTRTVLAEALPEQLASALSSSHDGFTRALWASSAGSDGCQLASGASCKPALAPRASTVGASRRSPTVELAVSTDGALGAQLSPRSGKPPVGSNAWAIAGSLTSDGRAILANDMHLDLSVPNVWYRAELSYADVRLRGLTLAGVPAVIVGSNEHVAWGLTALDGDVLDLVRLELDPARPGEYRTPQGWRRFETRREVVRVKGAPDVVVPVRTTIWGPVASEPLLGAPVARRWTALDPGAIDIGLLELDRARSLESALEVFNRAAGPACNAVVATRDGRVGWTVTGRLPRRTGFDGATSRSWSTANVGWDGYLDAELPRVLDPASGFVVNANQRMLAPERGPSLAHDYANGYRAYRISEALRASGSLNEAQVFQLQLDTKSEFFERYRSLALGALERRGQKATPREARLERVLEAWDGHADIDSRGLGVLARFRMQLAERVFSDVLARARRLEPGLDLMLPDIDGPLERVLGDGKEPLVPTPPGGWDAVILAALEAAAASLEAAHPSVALEEITWGSESTVDMRHPLAIEPELAARLDMPVQAVPGCGFCVRMAAGTLAASERLVVSPGREADGILHMPGGQSGDPSSEHYRDQHAAWVAGRALPYRAGAAKSVLRLAPPSASARGAH